MALADFARKIEHATHAWAAKKVSSCGWKPSITGYAGYGSATSARVLGRVLLAPPEGTASASMDQRGYRQFFTVEQGDVPVRVTLGAQTITATANAEGYIDVKFLDHGLEPGWHDARIEADGAQPADAPVLIVSDSARVGFVSDIDDTVLITWLPRALIAAWNSWGKRTNTRQPVPGMAEFYQELLRRHPDAPVVYLSTGAWNTFDTLRAFLQKHGFPAGPMLLTDWGPTPTGLFRNGQEHKRVQLRNLFLTYPDIDWVLIGDDGQHDPLTYADAATEHPDHVKAIAIRNLTPEQQLLSHGTMAPLVRTRVPGHGAIPLVQGADGTELAANFFAAVNEKEN